MPKISIITINYNNAIGLKKTIDSVSAQSYSDLEYIVIDGGSTDESVAIIKKNKNCISKWVSEKDNGIYNAMNKGIAMATGDYLLFLNSGDHFYKDDVLEESVDDFINEDIVCFDINLKDSENDFIHKHPDKLSFLFLFERTFAHQSVFIKRGLFEIVGYYDENLKMVSDWKFFTDAIVKHSATYKRINKTLSTFYFGGISCTPEGVILVENERKEVLKKEYSLYYDDYSFLISNRNLLNKERFKTLQRLEQSYAGRKLSSLVLKLLTFIVK
jgi:glycosyltransferase involved in cell wall biosynthesis